MAQVAVTGPGRRVREELVEILREVGHMVTVAERPRTVYGLIKSRHLELLIFCIPFPDVSIDQACRDLRRISNVPLLVIGPQQAKDETKLSAFSSGADDYLEAPFNPDELRARVTSLVRRGHSQDPDYEIMDAGDVVIDRAGAEITVRGTPMQIPRKEFELLSTLVENQGRVLTRKELLDHVWGDGYLDENRTLDVHIKRLRSRIETDPHRPKHLITVRGRGYKFSR